MRKLIFISVLALNMSFGQNLDSIFNPLKFRNIGPFRGGRSNSGTGVIGDKLTYYMGTTGGGVWKHQMLDNTGEIFQMVIFSLDR
jgi:hypothetical protein